MDEETKSILRDIATELRERNELTRAASARSEERLAKTDERMDQIRARGEALGGGNLDDMKARHEERMANFREQGAQRNAERSQFQKELLSELRRMNANLEAIVNRDLD